VAGNENGFYLDELRIGTTWAAVTPASDLPPAEGYAAWRDSTFGADAGNPAISGPHADPDGDGVKNLLEYALGRNPLAASRAGLPTVSRQTFTVDGQQGTYLTLTFTKPNAVTDVGYNVEVSGGLASWGGGAVLESATDNGETTTYIYRDAVPLTSESRRFMRLSVTQQ